MAAQIAGVYIYLVWSKWASITPVTAITGSRLMPAVTLFHRMPLSWRYIPILLIDLKKAKERRKLV